MKYKVEHMTASGWADAEWTEESNGVNSPLRFNSKKEANEEIFDHVDDSQEAVAKGYMTEAYQVTDYRVVPVGDDQ